MATIFTKHQKSTHYPPGFLVHRSKDSSHMSIETISARISHMENYVDYTSGEFGSLTKVFAGSGCF